MKLHPLDDRIVVRPGESEETTASGLVIPDTAKEKPQQGEVLAVGPGRRAENTGELIPVDVAVGRHRRLLASTAAPRSPSTARTSSSSPAVTCSPRSSRSRATVMSKILKFDEAARRGLEAGVDQAGRHRQGDARPEGPQRRHRQEVRCPHHHQRRRVHRP